MRLLFFRHQGVFYILHLQDLQFFCLLLLYRILRTPHPNIIKNWASLRDLDDLFVKFGKEEGGKKIVDLVSAGYKKLLGGGKITNAYSVKVEQFTASAEEKLKAVGGEVLTNNG